MPNKRSITSNIPTQGLPLTVDTIIKSEESKRKGFERRWYDNNFFDDGFHFRYVSRTTGKIIDVTDRTINMPNRAIPKASRQIRGVANLILGAEPMPVVYPQKVSQSNYPDPQSLETANQAARDIAKKSGLWVEQEWKSQELKEKLTHMVLLAAKHGVSFLQVWPDDVDEKIRTQIFDAFDIYLDGTLTSIYDSPYIIKAVPMLVAKIKANENYDEEQLARISPDNKFASSEVKEAYMKARFGVGTDSDYATTLILKECFFKEYLSDDNWADAKKLGEKNGALEGKSKGDLIIRHSFTAGGVWLKDEYVDLSDYPFVDFRFEPGPIYQVPLIEKFIPANKSLDIIASRIERFANTMVSGIWLKRKGEDFQISNIAGGQMVEYDGTPPTQASMASIPSYMFNYMEFLEKNIEEQGASTSALGQLPSGVKSGVAIESLKATEYANLKIVTDQLKGTVKRITERMLDIASKYFIKPQTVMILDQNKPEYFDIIGQAGIEAREKAEVPLPEDIVPIKGDYKVDIEIESGLGFTQAGKKETAQQIIQFMIQMAQMGLLTMDAVKVMLQRLLEAYQFGSTQEFMEALESGTSPIPLTEEQITQMKVAVIEALKEAGYIGEEMDNKMVNSTKVGVVEALKDLAGQGNQTAQLEELSIKPTQ